MLGHMGGSARNGSRYSYQRHCTALDQYTHRPRGSSAAVSASEPTVSLQSPELVAQTAALLASDNNYLNKTIVNYKVVSTRPKRYSLETNCLKT
jgi:hypothetical protein